MTVAIPTHVGFIVDGNRRWAAEHGLSPHEGHEEGYKVLKEVLIETLHSGVKYASVYIFSTENWKRSKEEVNRIMKLLVRVLRSDGRLFAENNIKVRIVGNRGELNADVVRSINNVESATSQQTGGQMLICLNYGGQQEIIHALKQIMNKEVSAEDITTELIEQNLYASDVPACDLIVRTGGEQRLSNFMMWRSAYSELMFLDKYWPEMTKHDVGLILDEYARRTRRFGG